MSKPTPKQLLETCLENAKVEEYGFISAASLNFNALRRIATENLYGEGIDYPLLWNIFFSSSIQVTNDTESDRLVTDEEKQKIISKVDSLITGSPYSYLFYFKLPDQYSGTFGELSGNVRIIKANEKLQVCSLPLTRLPKKKVYLMRLRGYWITVAKNCLRKMKYT